MRTILGLAAVLLIGEISPVVGQAVCHQPSAVCEVRIKQSADSRRVSFQQAVVHHGKWLTAASVAAFTIVAANEHRQSRREWNSLLTICRSGQDACVTGADGRYLRSDAEALYQRSRAYDRRANRWLVGAQLSLIATTALFLIDLHPGDGPENIPFPANQIDVSPTPDGATFGLRLSF